MGKALRNTGTGQIEFTSIIEQAGLPDDFNKIHVRQLISDLRRDLGLSRSEWDTLEFFINLTRDIDWTAGQRPIVWPSRQYHAQICQITENTARRAVQQLIKQRLIIAKDSGNMRRYGHRDTQGRIVEAYGFDLSPLALRFNELSDLREAIRAEQTAFSQARKKVMSVRAHIRDLQDNDAINTYCKREYAAVAAYAIEAGQSLRKIKSSGAMVDLANRLQRRRAELEQQTAERARLAERAASTAAVKIAAIERQAVSEIDPVLYEEKSSQGDGTVSPYDTDYEPVQITTVVSSRDDVADCNGGPLSIDIDGFRVGPNELNELIPTLHERRYPVGWREAAEEADRQLIELGINRKLFNRAASPTAMGLHQAIIAVLLISSNPAVKRPPAYFNGLVTRAERGQLNLGRTLWKLKKAEAPSQRRSQANYTYGVL